jgi:hypothetical protein
MQNSSIDDNNASINMEYQIEQRVWGNVVYTPAIIKNMGTIRIFPDQEISENAIAYIYWVKGTEYILIDTANYNERFLVTHRLPAGEYIIRVVADGYLSTFYTGADNYAGDSWKDESIKKVSPDSDITFVLEKKIALVDEKINFSGIVEEVIKSSLKATTRVLQRSTVTLHSSSRSIQKKAPEPDWILVATTQTDDNGAYSFSNLPKGEYRITVDIPGYFDSESIIIQANSSGVIYGNQNFLANEEARTIKANAEQIIISAYGSNEEIQLSAYPNPAMDVVHIDGLEGNYIVKIINMTGRVVKSVAGASPELTLPVNDLSSGMYLLRIESLGKVRTLKLIKGH